MEFIGVGDLVELVEFVPKKDLHKGSVIQVLARVLKYKSIRANLYS